MKKLWFRRKLYGWGWYPVTWQGWLVTLGYIFLILFFSFRIDEKSYLVRDTIFGIFVPFTCLTFLLIFICYKTGEKPKWQWGREEKKIPKVGVGVMILKDGKVLLGKRIYSHGHGEYLFPGGHLEHLESFFDCVIRETKEECGIEIENISFHTVINDTFYKPKHYTSFIFKADWKSGEPEVLEANKIVEWDWYSLDNLPNPLFYSCARSIEAHKTGQKFYDTE